MDEVQVKMLKAQIVEDVYALEVGHQYTNCKLGACYACILKTNSDEECVVNGASGKEWSWVKPMLEERVRRCRKLLGPSKIITDW